jgi:hypothetical protein
MTPEERRAAKRDWARRNREENPEKCRQARRASYAKHRELELARRKAYYAKNREEILRKMREVWKQPDPEKRRERQRAWRKINREKRCEQNRGSYARNRQEISARRRAAGGRTIFWPAGPLNSRLAIVWLKPKLADA